MNKNEEELLIEEKVPVGEFVEPDEEEVRFKALVKLYIAGEITYFELMALSPMYERSMFSKLSKLLLKIAD